MRRHTLTRRSILCALELYRSGKRHSNLVSHGPQYTTDYLDEFLYPSPEKQTVFPTEAEDKLASSIKEAASMVVGLSKQQMIAKAAKLAQIMKLKPLFKNGVPGKDWTNVKDHNAIAVYDKEH